LGLATAQSRHYKPLVVLQSVIYVMLFVSQHTCSTLLFAFMMNYFLAVKSKNQRAAPTTQKQKDTPQKTA
jgi:hypothetical protein